MRKNNTKRALLLSCLSLLLCVSMLAGSTFAWFTDTASTSVNTIQSGKLDVVLEYWNRDTRAWENAEGISLDFLKSKMDMDYGDTILWEPGCTYELPKLRISNAGNLALKFDVVITGIDGDAKLNEAIEWTYDYTVDYDDNWNGVIDEGETFPAFDSLKHPSGGWKLLPADSHGIHMGSGNSYMYLDITGHMKEEAGNEYQDLTIEGISITVVATQLNYEHDTNGPLYDFEAEYPVIDAGALSDALASGEDFSIGGGEYNEAITVGAGQTVTIEDAAINNNLNVENGSTVVINDADVATSWSTRINLTDATLVINDGEYNGVSLYENYNDGSKVVINDGTFNLQYLTLTNNQSTEIIITGGTFNGLQYIIAWNGAPNCTISGGTFTTDPTTFGAVIDGTVIDNGNGTWTVQ